MTTLIWSDEFDGPAGAPPDPAVWSFEVGGPGQHNDELQAYTAENATLDGDGNLAIVVRRDGAGFTSARLVTKGRFTFTYGLVEARIRLPRGLWPAFWMLGDDIDDAGWPACGEIDVLENFGDSPSVVHGTLHGPGYAGPDGITAAHDAGADLSDDFHVYAVDRQPSSISWYVDGHRYQTLTPADVPAGEWPFDHDFYLLLNVAVGGTLSPAPTDETAFPQSMLIDWIRVTRTV